MTGKVAGIGNKHFNRNPAGHTHGVLLDQLRIDQLFAAARLEPVPCFNVNILCIEGFAAFLRLFHIFLYCRHVHTHQLIGWLENKSAFRFAVIDFVCESFLFRAGTGPWTASHGTVFCHVTTSVFLSWVNTLFE